jgi:hypothetical protein
MRALDTMQDSIRLLAAPLAERLGRPADDFRTIAFMGACVGAIINAILAWVHGDDDLDVVSTIDEALSVIADGP